MDAHRAERRRFLKQMTVLATAAGLPPLLTGKSAAQGRSGMKTSYDPAATFELKVSEVDFLRTPGGRQLMARIYQPQGAGPFPTVLDLHGGAWRRKDRFAEEPMDRAIAAGGVVVVAIDLRLSDEAPYPASVQDANYGVRWLKSRAAKWNGDPSKIGVYGSSSGGHVAQLLAMRPRDPRYNAFALPGAPQLDVRDLEARMAHRCEPGHLQPVGGRGHRRRSMWRHVGRDEQNSIKTGASGGRFGHGDVPEVNRVEGAPDDADLHNRYSNSISAIRTMSPGSAPASSSADDTPRRSRAT